MVFNIYIKKKKNWFYYVFIFVEEIWTFHMYQKQTNYFVNVSCFYLMKCPFKRSLNLQKTKQNAKNDMYMLTSIRDYYKKQLAIRYAYNSWENQYFVSLTWNKKKKIEIFYYSKTLFKLQNIKKKKVE